MLVSIVIPTFNRAEFLNIAIDSVEQQDCADYELLIVDDRSTDETAELIATRKENNPRIRYLQNGRPQGVSGARNFGIDNAQGEFIAFLDSDDSWYDDHLESGISFLKEHDEADFFFGNRVSCEIDTGRIVLDYFEYIGAPESVQGQPCGGEYYLVTDGLVAGLIRGNLVGVQTSILRRDRLNGLRFDESIPVAEDRDFYLRFALTGNRIAGMRTGPTTRHTVHPGSLSDPAPANQVRFLEAHIDSFERILSGEYRLGDAEKRLMRAEIAKKQRMIPYCFREAGQFGKAAKATWRNFAVIGVARSILELVKISIEAAWSPVTNRNR